MPDIYLTYICAWHIFYTYLCLTYIWQIFVLDIYFAHTCAWHIFETYLCLTYIWHIFVPDIYLRLTFIQTFFSLCSLVLLAAKTQTWRESNLKTFNSSLKLSVGLSGAGKYYRLCWLHVEKNKGVGVGYTLTYENSDRSNTSEHT